MISDSKKSYKYDAFISYSHIDQKAAHAMQHKLERYRIPKNIQKERGSISPKLKIFLDETDLSAGNLKENIYKSLDMSEKLIVICSSAPAPDGIDKYQWVTLEVQHFINTGRSNDIIPITIDGNWNALPSNIKPLASSQFIADVSVLGKRKAFLKVLSGILDINFDALVKRDNIRKREKRGFLFASFLILAAACNYYYMPHTNYYSDYIIRFGLPEGVNKLSTAQRTSKSDLYAITILRYRHELRLEHTNSAGLPSNDTAPNHIDPPTIAIYNCFDDWRINTVEYFDENKKELYTYVYAPDLSYVDLVKSKDDAKWLTAGSGKNEYNLPVRTNISRYQLIFYNNGLLSSRMYAVDRLAAVNENGIGGESYIYDDSGKIIRINYLDTNGGFTTDKYGIAAQNFKYNADGYNCRLEYLDSDNKLINNASWYAAIEKKYYNGNVSEIHYYNMENSPCISSDGYAINKWEHDRNGFLISSAYYDTKGVAAYGPYNYHKLSIKRDSKGRDIEHSYEDTEGNLILGPSKYATLVSEYNSSGQITDQFHYGINSEPVPDSIGAYHLQNEYDKQGNLIEIACYGTDGELTYTALGYAIIRLSYNDMGMETSQSYFGVHDEPILGKNNYHKQEFDYDPRYNIYQIRYTGVKGQPILCTSGYASRTLKYDNAGNILEDSFFDDYIQPTKITGQFARATMKYDEHGNRISRELFNPDGSPAEGAAYSKTEYSYDEAGRITESLFYKSGNLVSKRTYEYSLGGGISSQTDYSGPNAAEKQKISQYDAKGNEIATTQYDGSRIKSKTVREFDERRKITKESYYGPENELLRFYTTEFNPNGMPIRTAYFDGDGNLSREANPTERVAVTESDYNSQNQKIERRCFDENGNPLCITSDGKTTYARLVINRTKNSTESIYYDETGAVYQSVLQEHDEYNREGNRIYFDGSHKQLLRHEVLYNERGKPISNALYDGNDKLQADPISGVAKIIYVYDDYDYLISEEFYDADNKLYAPYNLYPKYVATRADARVTKIEYYGINGKLAPNPDGYAIEKFTYDDRGRETGRSFYDVNGNPILLKWRFSRYEITYDEVGNIKESRFFDAQNREIEQVDGYLSKSDFMISNIPQNLIGFVGNDGTSLMGHLEVKIYIPLNETVQLQSSKDIGADSVNPVPTVDNEPTKTTKQQDESAVKQSIPETEPEQDTAPEQKDSFSDREYIPAISNYIRAIECFDGVKMADALDITSFSTMVSTALSNENIKIPENKIYHIYASFYQEQLENLKEELADKYGDNIYITYKILSEEYQSEDIIYESNKVLKNLGINNINIQNIVMLKISYTVKGSKAQGSENIGFFNHPLTLYQENDKWVVSTGNTLPKPTTDEIVSLAK